MSQAAIAALGRGEVIVLATETIFGLAADPAHPQAVARLLRMKERPLHKGWILLVPDRECLDDWILPPSPLACALMDRFWPGPLTLVLPARPGVSPLLTGGGGHVALRLSPAPQVVDLMALWRRPLISTSANRAGQPTPGRAAAVRQIWREENLLVIDGPIRPDALPSTVLKVDGATLTLIRAGAIPYEAILA
ncbi:MAG: L-threonylcarbamoyladenylate synthase [Magnetococcales bacterium]|nr:L-threonylcarbamoyladenylate synthase [Magnetococcales bacterium]